ncbi:Uncharacterised protein [Zhongshania aliphaticivorans]|uniref:Uncharacterized protein n=1 Tax=Zhongshania aliphaticivorans TaxID=1470434 RepID=A0A5S9MV28_9GAMM|nr:AAA-like domain-containing protein [Zhongshania aliphaticivorans]CAA0080889.1 Uncharacterised protein [Zhongshania aliphaticivorans]CAA0085425.1 Uncharacterised protein [Zhongshania aliphaticivorans]
MKQKKLIPSTIIPKNLYIDRLADKQLREVIEDMGRPGYILVARQMGKTNLLINAKRTLEGKNDIICYIDLSNRSSSDRECFRNIIDKILETNTEKLSEITDEIHKKREELNSNPQREHVRELRLILGEIQGKLIINLDEIDSLTTADYSDKIFAHVRSIYFERINFKEFERLSYIISGVAEPSEIIKDKSISPFNIGQKILLGDFNYKEFEELLKKADIELSRDVKDRIFYWANGNPRLTWEICSAVEDNIIEGLNLCGESVDEIVFNNYLTSFNKPPVDHIRALVRADKELREAVVAINYDKSDILSDRVKSRLYLAGILGSDYEYGDIRIKNRIIEHALDETWLADIDRAEKLSFNKAEEYFEKRRYGDAIEIYKQVKSEAKDGDQEFMAASYKLGLSNFHLGNYQKSINEMADALYDKKGYRDLYMDQIYTLGMCNYKIEKDEQSLNYFNEIISDKNNPFYHEALINKAAILVRSGQDDSRNEAISLNKVVINLHEQGEIIKSQAISGAYYNVATLSKEDPEYSYANFCKAATAAEPKNSVSPLIEAINLNSKSIATHFPEIIEALKFNEIKLDEAGFKSGLELSGAKLADLITTLHTAKKIDLVDELFSIIQNHCFNEISNCAEAILDISLLCLNSNEIDTAKLALNKLKGLDRKFSTPEAVFLGNKYLSFIDPNDETAIDFYLKGFQNYIETTDHVDVAIFEREISKLISNSENDKAVKYANLIINLDGLNHGTIGAKLLTILFLKMNAQKEQSKVVEEALTIRKIISNIEKDGLPLSPSGKDNLPYIKRTTERMLISNQPIKQFIREEKKYGRNDIIKVKYEDGRMETKKFKYVQESIKAGLCIIVE